MTSPQNKRALLKLSGESLKGDSPSGIDYTVLRYVAGEIRQAREMGAQLAVVVGGGNLWRGEAAEAQGMDRVPADYAGMLATLISALALQDALERLQVPAPIQSALPLEAVTEPVNPRQALRHLEQGHVVLFAGGTGHPFFTTDTAAAVRGAELRVHLVLMAKNAVDGVYDADPNANPNAQRFTHLNYLQALNMRLQVMDPTALSLCMEHRIPILVFDLFTPGSLARALAGEPVGTLVSHRLSEAGVSA